MSLRDTVYIVILVQSGVPQYCRVFGTEADADKEAEGILSEVNADRENKFVDIEEYNEYSENVLTVMSGELHTEYAGVY